WRQIGERLEPWRAWPVPFCFHGFLPPPATSERSFVCARFWRLLAASAVVTWCTKSGRHFALKIFSGKVTAPTFAPVIENTGISIVETFLSSEALAEEGLPIFFVVLVAI